MAASISLKTDIAASAAKVSDALASGDGLASFWTSDSAAEPRVGSVARFGFGSAELLMRVDELSDERVAWTCMSDFPMEPYRWRGTRVTWDLASDDHGHTILQFQHGNWPDDLAQTDLASTAYTWSRVVTALKEYSETGTPQPVFAVRKAS